MVRSYGFPFGSSTVTIEFFSAGVLVATHAAAQYGYYRMSGGTFDRVILRVDAAYPAVFTLESIASRPGGIAVDPVGIPGCTGSPGTAPTQLPAASTPGPVPGNPYQIDLTGAAPFAPVVMTLGVAGFSGIDMGFLGGLPGCMIKIPMSPLPVFLPTTADGAGAASFTLVVPPRATFCTGERFSTEWWCADPGLSVALPVTTSNLLLHTVY